MSVTEMAQKHWKRYKEKFESEKPAIKAKIPWNKSRKNTRGELRRRCALTGLRWSLLRGRRHRACKITCYKQRLKGMYSRDTKSEKLLEFTVQGCA